MTRTCLAILLSLFALGASAADEELLEPEKAFVFSARMLDSGNLEAGFRIAKGYYLYRHKVKFSAEGAKLGSHALPPGKAKDDEFFGKVEIYPADIRIRIPVTGIQPGKTFSLKAEYQGCADIGVCYPPQQSTVRLSVPESKPASPMHPPIDQESRAEPAPARTEVQDPALIDRLKKLAGDFPGSQSTPDFLPADEAFQIQITADADGRLRADYTVAPGYYLYRDKIRLTVRSPASVKLVDLRLPEAKVKDDPTFGRTHIYQQSFTAEARLAGLPPGGTTVSIDAGYQGCSEKGICYPPTERTITFPVAASGSAMPAADPVPAPSPAAESGGDKAGDDTSESGKIAALLKGGNFWLVVASFFGFGLLLSLTPCVFPMIPILSGIIVGHGHHVTKSKGFMLSLAYVLGMAVTYAMAGVAAGMSGTLISNALQNPWSLGIGASIFVALALSMFGFYELQLPSFLQSRFTEASNRIKGGSSIGVFVMGALSALIVGPCVAAPLAGALLYIGQSGDVVLGGTSLFFLALGMGVPLLLVGLSAGALLPRAGAWMEAVKKFFGVLLLGVAVWLISPLISEVAHMLIWAALLIISGVYLRALDPLAGHTGGWPRFWKGVGIISLVAGIALLLGALGGGRDILQPLAVFKGGAAGAGQAESHLTFQRVRNVTELDAAVRGAQGRQVMLDFYADWCVSCKEMERFTFSDAKVQARLKDVLLLQADVTANSDEDKALLKRFNLFGPPGIIFFDKTGKEVAYRVVGYEPPEKFLASLDQGLR